MPKKRDFVKVSTRAPRFREDTALMKVHETMVDFIKAGGPSGSFMDILGAAGIFGLMQNIDVVPERDLIYSGDEDEDEDENFNEPNHTQELKPHPQLKEIDDKEAEQIKELEEEQKRKSKSVKNKRKKMRKKEKKRQEKEDGDSNVSPEEEQGNSSENEDLNNDKTNIDQNNIDNYKEIAKSTPNLSVKAITEEKHCKLIKEEETVILNKEKDKPPKNIELKNSKLSITESIPEEKKKSKNKPKKIEKAQSTQNNMVENVKLPEKQLTVDKPVKVKTKGNTVIKQEEKEGENKEESVDSVVEEYAKKSREMAGFGNKLAANGQYEMAIKCFTEAIKFNPREYKLFGNRSFCFEKMQRFEEALSDAEVSLSMEPNWIKGLFRKGKALCGLKKYYEASLAYRDVLNLDSTSQEARMELKRAQTLHLMEMGFTWTQSSNALKRHSSLEEAVEALFNGEGNFSPEENGACQLDMSQLSTAGHSVLNKEWEDVQLPTKYKSPPVFKKQGKMEVFPVWVGSLAPTVNYVTLQEVFSRAGKVFSIKMVLEHHCAFVNYTRKEDSARAIQLLNGLVLEGSPLAVRYPSRIPPGIGVSKDALTDPLTPPSVEKECFFWRTTGCTKDDCTFKHIPQNKGIDRGRFNHKPTHYN
ncbi:stress-induced-phosphoprotein 1-like [Boleophthalmus pectinirostris]|uniref:stress-induced-phosphoprotein 1-like n=1 Tax=Boleophthalmus pectinirostris TaxID=150288 RepID=UPI00242F2E29|nr:stress-induced-phosphoprotein 1-like [Boleophthalmus pectinirostris]